MNSLGWIIWGFGFLLLLKNLVQLRTKKRRVRRAVFSAITATALALTFFTPFSKFHLLWILPLHFILGLLAFGGLAAAGLAHHKLTARKPERKILPSGAFPPFDELNWSDYEWWEGTMRLPAWAGFQARGGPYNSIDSDSAGDGSAAVNVKPPETGTELEPTPEQCRAITFQIEHGDEVVKALLNALLPYYRELKDDWEASEDHMPPITDASEFRKKIGLGQIHVLSCSANGLAYIGLEFG
jgi:hypothetical protein